MAPSCVYPAMPRINNGLEIAFAADRYCPSVPETTKTFSRDTYWLVREGGRRLGSYRIFADRAKMDGYRADPIQIPCNGRMIERVIRFNESRFNSFPSFFLSFLPFLLSFREGTRV